MSEYSSPADLPVLESVRLTLRPRTLDDLEDCLEMDRDPEVVKFIPGPWHEDDPRDHRAFIIERMTTDYPKGMGYWTIREREGDVFVGWVILLPTNARGIGEIGWRLRRAAWGRGIATEAARLVLLHAFGTLGLDAVVADIDPYNTASARVAEKSGMTLLGEESVDGDIVFAYRLDNPLKR
ncbi:GNAT family N-acetyltransferase [Cucumibacter marinus]|uniref:GNAT family N-acetyltransferase n=1 Tax=Cucumibacter marinus TaxID=1121252 RepID=UPI000405BF3D|nr:GNAT family N-acetyltransferase [Cucumibacter marinus]